jgi:hypothetical protein
MSSETVEESGLCDLVGWVASHLVEKYLEGEDFPYQYALDIINHILKDYNSHNYDDLVTFLADAVDWKKQSFKRRVWDTLTDEEKAEFVNRLVRRIAEDGMKYYADLLRIIAFEWDGGLRGELAKLIRDRYLNGLISFQDMLNEVCAILDPDESKKEKLKRKRIGLELAKYLDEDTLKGIIKEYFDDY